MYQVASGGTCKVYKSDLWPGMVYKATIDPMWLSWLIEVGEVEGKYLGTTQSVSDMNNMFGESPVHLFRVREYLPNIHEEEDHDYKEILLDKLLCRIPHLDSTCHIVDDSCEDNWLIHPDSGEIIPYDAYRFFYPNTFGQGYRFFDKVIWDLTA